MHHERSTARTRRASRPRSTTTGLVLLALGALAFASNLSGYPLHGLWTAVLFVPAVAALLNAARVASDAGQVTPVAARYGLGGLALGLLGVTLLLGLAWPLVGPMFLMLFGAAALTGVRRRDLR
ncbi:hypothetical protein E5F05_02890 (plasmid) [Deinococcus metallilatus]|uniref:Uncharacterized protein n=1 Tax=Deinococcus metallilatus TaxID=1211322 RepID=A0AAJ5F6K0_9DEIO|nr:hypothetical protein [Deinococcus metallilatus]MBB5295650.1 hypothetical protein [Deinococcus metallilatus]QBY06890.1 hypothetical protein E5F05_02890 [Deinococcus metallilatus]TLK32280.1 hypothetical protein FCS05_02225 [Deinococcus metallilatus]GMA14179.1 hypothetical protein GCM10025871_05100 [Deinococcus metallilatus]